MNLLLLRSVARLPWSRVIAMHLKCDPAGEVSIPGCIYRSTSWRRRVMDPSLHDASDMHSEIVSIALGIVIQGKCEHAGRNVKKYNFAG